MGDGAAPIADEMVVRVVVRGLEVSTIGPEICSEQEAFGHEEVERAIDRRWVDLRQSGTDAVDDVVGTQVLVGLGRNRVPDELPLAGEPPTSRAQVAGLRERRVGVSVSKRLPLVHVDVMMPPPTDRTEPRTVANDSRYQWLLQPDRDKLAGRRLRWLAGRKR